MDALVQSMRGLATSLRAVATQLDAVVDLQLSRSSLQVTPGGTNEARAQGRRTDRVFDPMRDVPPVTPVPQGERVQQDWCGLMLFGGLHAVNVREGRGATRTELLGIARAAGYQDRRAFAGWAWTWRDDESGGRWVTDDEDLSDDDQTAGRWSGMAFLRHYVQAVGVAFPEDLPL